MLASAAAAEGTPSLPASLSPALELLPAAPLDRQLYCNASLQTWGGNVLEDDAGGFHLYAAGFGTGNCGLNEWLTNSDVIHAVSDSPDGPFSYRDTAVPLWAHNPQAIRAPDGKWLLYQIARRNCQPRYTWKIPFCNESKKERLPCPPGAKPAGNTTAELCAALGSRPRDPNCHGSSAPECHCDSHRIEIYSADSPNGPWSRFTPSPDLYDGSIVACEPSHRVDCHCLREGVSNDSDQSTCICAPCVDVPSVTATPIDTQKPAPAQTAPTPPRSSFPTAASPWSRLHSATILHSASPALYAWQ